MKAAAWLALLLGSGCTMVTGAGDYEVDPEKEQEIADMMAMSMVRDLDYSFAGMSTTHADTPLDVAVVDERDVLQARARIILPKIVDGVEPTERLVMKRALTPGEQRLYFFADSNGDNEIQGTRAQIVEHIWVEPVPASGLGTFTHSLNFVFFSEDEFTQNQDLILEPPTLDDLGILDPEELAACVSKKFDGLFEETFEVKVFLTSEERQMGYFKMYEDGMPPEDFRVVLPGIIDSGSEYSFQVLLDGKLEDGNEFTEMAPASGPMVVPARKWLGLQRLPMISCR